MNCASFKAFLSFVFVFILRLIGCQLGWNGCPLIWKTFAILEEVFSLSLSLFLFLLPGTPDVLLILAVGSFLYFADFNAEVV